VTAGTETLNIVSSGISSPATAAGTAENSIASLAGSTGLTTINVSGASDFALTTTGAISTITTIDGSAMTGRFTATNGSTSSTATTMSGGSAADTLNGRSGIDNIAGNAGNDTIDGADGNDTLSGDAGNDQITGGSGNDVITGGAGNDTIDSEGGVDSVDGGDGDDTFNISSAAYNTTLTSSDTIIGGEGTDTLSFTRAGDTSVDLVTNSSILTNVSGIDKIALGAAAGQTLTIMTWFWLSVTIQKSLWKPRLHKLTRSMQVQS